MLQHVDVSDTLLLLNGGDGGAAALLLLLHGGSGRLALFLLPKDKGDGANKE